ncbi:hypothetical protein SANA_04170 [Gottschalkiaceae bacterium SANA]|nr:hypothetical protein SANA_04170 [Gottschalkiaceae bacterium SANA]
MNALHWFSFPLIIELVGALLFLLIFLKFIGKVTGVTSFAQKIIWKLALVGFVVMTFISINTMMFHFEFAREAKLDRAISVFNESKSSIEIIGIEKSKSEVFTYEMDRKSIHFYVRDLSTKEIAPCYIKRENTYVYLNDFVETPFIIFNSTENTIDLHLPGDAINVSVGEVKKEALDLRQIESEYLCSFLASIDILEE